jgi:hypothetical protein
MDAASSARIEQLSAGLPWRKLKISDKSRQRHLDGGARTATCGVTRSFSKQHCQPSRWVLQLAALPEGRELLRCVNTAVHRRFPNFRYTTIQMNVNWPGQLHVDRQNVGPSVMLTVGSAVQGGELFVYDPRSRQGVVHETLNRLLPFNGQHPHATLPYSGTRYSFVLFTGTYYADFPSRPKDLALLRGLLFALPTRAEARAARGTPRRRRTLLRVLLQDARSAAERAGALIPA